MMCFVMLRRIGSATLAAVAAAVVTTGVALAAATGSHSAPSMLPESARMIDSSTRVALPHNVRPELNSKTDLGAVEDSMPVERMVLVLQRDPQRQAELRALIEHQHQAGAAEYHQWLTPEQFGERFGASEHDLTVLTEWLEQQGFTVKGVLKNNSEIEFTGTAGTVRNAFHTQLEYVMVDGKRAYANAQDPQIPSALAGIVGGIAGLHTIPARASHTRPRSVAFDPQTRTWHRNPADASLAEHGTAAGLKANYSDGQGDYYVTPGDYFTIYNVNPVYSAGYKGSGNTVGVAEQSDIAYGTVSSNVATGGDVTTFRNTFGISGTLSMYVYHGAGAATCTDPGVQDGDEVEATLDAEWANALAPAAKLIFMSCNSGSGGVIQALTALVDQNLADTISMSYGSSELDLTTADYTELNTIYTQAATQGQSVFVSTGDSGSDVYDQNTTGVATHGVNVSGFSSGPYVTATGGTDFQDYYDTILDSSLSQGTYWSSTNAANYSDALSYVPETAWNDSCASSIFANANGYTPAGFCAIDPTTSSGISFLVGDVVGGSGGFSTEYATPSYQSGITGYSGTKRAQPDVAMFGSDGFWGHALLFCDSDTSDPDGESTANCSNTSNFGAAGGTSFVAPAMAGIAALLDDYTGTRQGVLNYALYALGKAQYTSSATETACYANGQTNNVGVTTGLPNAACIFNDVTTGTNDEGCQSGDLDCYVNSGEPYGILSSTGSSSLTTAYPATAGYDEVAGIGSLNVYNLLTKWSTAFSSSNALTSSSTAITTAQSTTLSATVTGGTPAGYTGKVPTLAGTITFYSGTTSVGSCTLSSGSCSLSATGLQLGVGADALTATFTGSNAYPTSTSKVVTVTTTATTTTTATATPASATYGSSVSLKATVTPAAGTATGTVTFTSGTTTLGSCTLSSETCSIATTALPVGADAITVAYGGATYYATSSGSTTVNVTAATTTTTVTATPASGSYGTSITLKATVSSGSATGAVSFTSGTATLGTCTLASGSCSVSTTALPVGTDTVTAAYAGSTDYQASSGTTSVTISAVTTTTAVAATPASGSYGTSVSLKATVTPAAATGTVVFASGTTSLGSCTLSSGSCTVSTTALPVGSDTVTASYAGATDYAASSGSASVTISNISTTTTVAATPASVAYGAKVTLKATVAAASGSAGGTVSFTAYGLALGTCTLASGSCSVSATASVAPGTYAVTASYSGATGYAASSGSSSVVVTTAATTTTVAASPNPVTVGQNIALSATVASAGGTATGTVTFTVGTTTLGTCTLSGGACTLTANTNGQGAGTYPVVGSYGGSADFASSSSASYSVVVNKATPTVTVSVSPSTITPPANATLTATVARPVGSSGTPTGTVTFYSGSTLIGTANLNSSGVASFTQATTGLGAGTYPVTANYSGDSGDNAATGSGSAKLN